MQKKGNNSGFSLAEVLIVVAIVIVLAAVAFVAVQNHQKSMTQLEYDTIAKEIFVAAQNHLTAAESQGYPGLSPTITEREEKSEYGVPDALFSENKEKDKVYYIAYPNPGTAKGMLELMLPFGAIDETIRAGGSYIIRYQPSSARVLDVFYSNKGHTAWLTTKGKDLPSSAFEDLMNNCRKTGIKEYQGALVGWYGNGDALPVGDRLEAPQILIYNEETLWIAVEDTNEPDTSLVLIITGETSEAKKVFYLRNGTNVTNGNRITGLNVVLDDITQPGFHFAEIKAESSTPPFIPGENIIVEAVAYNNNALTNVAYSGKGRTNSIFADPSSYVPKQTSTSTGTQVKKTDDLAINGTIVDETSGTAAVTNFRHLENLDRIISNWGKDLEEVNTKEIKFTSAIQLTNLSDSDSDKLSWTSFVEKTHGSIISLKKGQTDSENYMPVYLENGFDYFGRNHIVGDVKSNGILTGDAERNKAGVFGELNGGSVSDILVMDAEITGSGNAGCLIGSMSGTTVERCAANGTVSSRAAAGGLIGSASGGSVTACYSGGHTDGTYASYYKDGTVTYGTAGKPDNGIYNIVATAGEAGGLIGSAGNTGINCSYSTCSVKGNTAGGFVGSGSGIIDNCYATGLVNGTTEGAFAGSYSGTASDITGCYYYEIINERKGENGAFTYLEPCSGSDSYEAITALDASAKTYNDFSLPSEDESYAWQAAVPYDTALKTYYTNKDGEPVYNLRTVAQLGATLEMDSEGNVTAIVATHYGDWPAPEIFVINTNS